MLQLITARKPRQKDLDRPSSFLRKLLWRRALLLLAFLTCRLNDVIHAQQDTGSLYIQYEKQKHIVNKRVEMTECE